MAVLDVEQGWFRVDDLELLALAALEGPPPPPELGPTVELDQARAALDEAGLIVDHAPAPTVAHILQIIDAPYLEIVIETFVVSEVRAHDIAVRPEGAVLRRLTPDGQVEMHAIDLRDLVPRLCRWLGVGPRPDPDCDHPIVVPVDVLPAVASTESEIDGTDGVAALEAAGLDHDDAETAVLVVLERRVSWRATAVWAAGPDTAGSRDLTVIDGGRMGWWFADPDPDAGTVTLLPTSAAAVARRLGDLIAQPPTGEFSPFPRRT
ncbi:MAG: ESX secretion-associated protein EspG [Iamia sp.]